MNQIFSRELRQGGVLQRGSRGPRVELLQEALDLIGFDPGDLNGVFGADTYEAVCSFQEDCDLNVTGVVNGETLEALLEALDDDVSELDEDDLFA